MKYDVADKCFNYARHVDSVIAYSRYKTKYFKCAKIQRTINVCQFQLGVYFICRLHRLFDGTLHESISSAFVLSWTVVRVRVTSTFSSTCFLRFSISSARCILVLDAATSGKCCRDCD